MRESTVSMLSYRRRSLLEVPREDDSALSASASVSSRLGTLLRCVGSPSVGVRRPKVADEGEGATLLPADQARRCGGDRGVCAGCRT